MNDSMLPKVMFGESSEVVALRLTDVLGGMDHSGGGGSIVDRQAGSRMAEWNGGGGGDKMKRGEWDSLDVFLIKTDSQAPCGFPPTLRLR